MPPFARYAIFPISLRLKPKDFPPSAGTQSGILMFILFRPRIMRLTPEIRPLIMPIMRLSGAFAIATRPSKTPLKMSFTLSHAFFQSPLKTAETKSMMPSKIFLMESQTPPTILKKAFRRSPRTPNCWDQSFVKMFFRKSSTFWRIALIWSPFVAMSVTRATIAAIRRTIGLATMNEIAEDRTPMAVEIPPMMDASGEIAATTPATMRMVFSVSLSSVPSHVTTSPIFVAMVSMAGARLVSSSAPTSARVAVVRAFTSSMVSPVDVSLPMVSSERIRPIS